jgi:CheY-like chemotaxis protein
MKDLHCNINIDFNVDDIQSMCSHIVTDKQWLQENLLCLLSNAVKYSKQDSENVKISVKLVEKVAKSLPNVDLLNLNFNSKSVKSRHKNFDFDENFSSKKIRNMEAQLLTQVDNLPLENEENKQAASVCQFVRFEVQDQGIGMTDERMNAIFKPFSNRQAGGSGLGLFSLARRVEALQGFYGVEQRKDGLSGTLFWFEIPYRPDIVYSLETKSRSKSSTSCCSDYTFNISNSIDDNQDIKNSISDNDLNNQNNNTQLDLNFMTSNNNIDTNNNIENYKNQDKIFQSTNFRLSFGRSKSVGVLCQSDRSNALKEAKSCDTSNNCTPRTSRRSLNILLVDDSISILKMTSMLLKRNGHEVSTAENGADAVAIITEKLKKNPCKKPFDVVLMDMQMPVMDGLEAIRQIRSLESSFLATSSSTPAVAIIDNVESNIDDCYGDSKEAVVEDDNDFLHQKQKPFSTMNSRLQTISKVRSCTFLNKNHNSSKKFDSAYDAADAGASNKNSKTQTHLRIISLSANSDYLTIEDAMKAGADDFVSKPFSLQDFHEKYFNL